jgi:hypothetical protein
MSGSVGILLGILAWWLDFPAQKGAFVIASVVCILVATFMLWYAERNERLRLQRESGPNLLMKLIRPQSALEIIRLINDGDESAIKVELEESPTERIKVEAIPWSVPFLRVSESEDLRAHFYEQVTPNERRGRALKDFLAGDLNAMNLAVRFENSKGVRFRRRFALRREMLQGEVHCYPDAREIIDNREAN